MREIEFRGKAKFDDDMWMYGYYKYNRKNNLARIEWVNDFGEWSDEFVIPETVGQYTGLKDKNGVKIFEGDIILWPSDANVYAVVYITEVASFVGRCKTKNDFEYLDNGIGENQSLKVIGNIHDNSELFDI